MNGAFKRLKREECSGRPLAGTVLGIERINGLDFVIIDYEGCRVVVPAPKEMTWRQLTQFLGTDMNFFVAVVDSENGIAVGYCHTSPRGSGSLSSGES